MRIKMKEAVDAYIRMYNQGRGWAPYRDVAGDDTVDAAVDAAVADDWILVASPANSSEVAVLAHADGDIIAIGGTTHGGGAWAVDITSEVTEAGWLISHEWTCDEIEVA